MMMKRFTESRATRKRGWAGIAACILTAVCVAVPVYADKAVTVNDDEARAIMNKVDARDDGDNSVSDMKMILIDKNGKTRERTMRAFGKDVGEDTYQIMFFTEPATVKDTAFLTYDYDDPDKDDDQWLYLPALKTTKRIAASDKTDSFMGSDFSYADMIKTDVDNYNYQLLKEDEVYGAKVWVIQSIPRTQKIIDTYGYSKSVVFVRQDNLMVVRAVLWLADSNKLKFLDVKTMEQIDGIWVATETHMTTKRGKDPIHSTVLIRENTHFNQPLEDDLFTVRKLEKGL